MLSRSACIRVERRGGRQPSLLLCVQLAELLKGPKRLQRRFALGRRGGDGEPLAVPPQVDGDVGVQQANLLHHAGGHVGVVGGDVDAQRLAVSGGAQVGLDAHPEAVPFGGLHVLRVGALGALHLLDGGGGSGFGGGIVVRRRGGRRWVGGWGQVGIFDLAAFWYHSFQDFLPFCPLRLGHISGEGNGLEGVTMIENVGAKRWWICSREGDICQFCAVTKCTVTDAGDAARNGDAGQTCAVINASSPMVVTPSGMSTLVRSEHIKMHRYRWR